MSANYYGNSITIIDHFIPQSLTTIINHALSCKNSCNNKSTTVIDTFALYKIIIIIDFFFTKKDYIL